MKNVTVLMSTYNGETYLKEQIDSILAQEGIRVKLLVRDDGSKDSTQQILDDYSKRGLLEWYKGENLKSARSFMNLVDTVSLDADYYAFSDQDDFWEKDKLSRAIGMLNQFDEDEPSLYCSETLLVDVQLNEIGITKRRIDYTSYKNILAHSSAPGCTMCMSRGLVKYLKKPHKDFGIMHDNWAIKVCASLGGNVVHDNESRIMYRQHDHNVVGGSNQNRNTFKRHIKEIRKNKCYRGDAIGALYDAYHDEMPKEQETICKMLGGYRKNRFRIIRDKGFRTGNPKNDFYFVISILLGLY